MMAAPHKKSTAGGDRYKSYIIYLTKRLRSTLLSGAASHAVSNLVADVEKIVAPPVPAPTLKAGYVLANRRLERAAHEVQVYRYYSQEAKYPKGYHRSIFDLLNPKCKPIPPHDERNLTHNL
jgi:hypothetical protein